MPDYVIPEALYTQVTDHLRECGEDDLLVQMAESVRVQPTPAELRDQWEATEKRLREPSHAPVITNDPRD